MTPNGCTSTRRVTFIVTLCAIAIGTVVLVEIDPSALCLLPALALALPLLLRRYPGERVLAGLAVARRPRWPRARASVSRSGRLFTVAPHGGLLIARSLAVRPPPALSSVS